MCIIVVKKAGATLRKDYMQNCYNINGHGCGIASINDGKVEVIKGVMEFEAFWNIIDAAQKRNLDNPILVHFRIKTNGEIDDFNCHPFQIDAEHALVHNGTLYDFSAKNSKVSDTYLFVDNIIKPMFEHDKKLYRQKFQRYIIEECVGNRNKLAILAADGNCIIYNESAGYWDEGVWYSKKDYLPPPPPVPKKTKYCGRRGDREKTPKPTAYKMKDGTRPLNAQEISNLTHEYKQKLKWLVQHDIVEPFSFTEVPATKGSPNFVEYWKKYGVVVISD